MAEPDHPAAPAAMQEGREALTRRCYITKRFVQKYGATVGCRGCSEVGNTLLEACRERLLRAIEGDETESWRLKEYECKHGLDVGGGESPKMRAEPV